MENTDNMSQASDELELVVSGETLEDVDHTGSVESEEFSSQASQSETASETSYDLEPEKALTHKISLINILEISATNVCVSNDSDLEEDQVDMMSDALATCNSKYDKTSRMQKLEKAIKLKQESPASPHPSPRRQVYTASPSHNASRFCRRPKNRAASDGGSPIHTGLHTNGSLTNVTRAETPCQVSITSLNANVYLPMDRLSTKLFNPPERSLTAASIRMPYQYGGSCFGGRGRKPKHYVIHPDWVSENFSADKVQLSDRNGQEIIAYMKRSQSCPPSQRNVITWEDKSPQGDKTMSERF